SRLCTALKVSSRSSKAAQAPGSMSFSVSAAIDWCRSVGASLRTARGRVSLGGGDLRLKPKRAVALSMALNELGTNALKYGALS
ncbi:hypothetical protein ACTUQ0_15100, partial [Listeria monocytogenes]|uniref:hypothetical protein n=1 Tax=Listeria monocytogenes TaxID=1639 RepID=UPI003FA4BFBE